jgi:gas vesicle protein
MENKDNHNHNGSGNGFLLGVIVGALITLLFTTKKGRAILKDVMEKGVQKFADLEQLMQEAEEELEDETGDDYIPAEPVEESEPPKAQKPVEKKTEEVTKQPIQKILPPTKPAKEESKFLDEEMNKNNAPEEEQAPPEPVEEKPKTTPVKRLFRGLRKKS